MTVANRLRAALAAYVLSVLALAILYANAARRAANENRALGETAEQLNIAANQLARLDEMSADAEKYQATNDVRYRDKFATAFRDFGEFDVKVMQPQRSEE